MRSLHAIVVTASLLCSAACTVKEATLEVSVIQLPVETEVRALKVMDDSLFAAGGAFNGDGFLCSGNLLTESFVIDRAGLKHEIHAMDRVDSRWYVGGDSLLVYSGSTLADVRQLYWRMDDWVSDLSKHPIRAIVSDSVGTLMVVGGELAYGVVYHSYDDGFSWDPIEEYNAFHCAEIRDGYAWVGGNGILMRSLWGTGEWERLRLEDQYITALHFFNSLEGLAMNERGSILETDDGGSSWTRVHRKHAPFMRSMASDGEAVVCVGDNATLLYRADAIADWKLIRLSDFEEFFEVEIHNDVCYIAADGGRVVTFPLAALK